MAWRLDVAKPLTEPVLEYCQLDPWEQTSVTFQSEFNSNISIKENAFENVSYCQFVCNWLNSTDADSLSKTSWASSHTYLILCENMPMSESQIHAYTHAFNIKLAHTNSRGLASSEMINNPHFFKIMSDFRR